MSSPLAHCASQTCLGLMHASAYFEEIFVGSCWWLASLESDQVHKRWALCYSMSGRIMSQGSGMFKGQTRKEENEQTGHHRIGAGGCNYPSGHCLRQSII